MAIILLGVITWAQGLIKQPEEVGDRGKPY
jgi:hypothetical protein